MTIGDGNRIRVGSYVYQVFTGIACTPLVAVRQGTSGDGEADNARIILSAQQILGNGSYVQLRGRFVDLYRGGGGFSGTIGDSNGMCAGNHA